MTTPTPDRDLEDTRFLYGEYDRRDYDAEYQMMLDAADFYYDNEGDR
jgi:hypothetical protein